MMMMISSVPWLRLIPLFIMPRSVLFARSLHSKAILRQASHWHDKRFTPWHAIWRASDWGKNSWQCAWRCVGMRIRWSSAYHVVAKILKCSKSNVSRLVTTKLLSARAWHWMSRISWKFATYARQMARHVNVNVNVNVNLYSASSQKATLMRSMCRVLIKKTRLQCATKTVNLHVWLTQIVSEQVPCRWSSDNEGATAVRIELKPWNNE